MHIYYCSTQPKLKPSLAGLIGPNFTFYGAQTAPKLGHKPLSQLLDKLGHDDFRHNEPAQSTGDFLFSQKKLAAILDF